MQVQRTGLEGGLEDVRDVGEEDVVEKISELAFSPAGLIVSISCFSLSLFFKS